MTDQKKNDGKKSTRKIKATTGAWWKTIVEDEPEQSAPAVTSKTEVAPDVGQAVAPDSKAEDVPVRKKTPAKSISGAAEDKAGSTPVQAEAEQVKKPRPRRAPRRKKTEEPAQQPLAEQPESTTPAPTAVPVEAKSADADTAAPAARKPARKRSPRKKKTVAEDIPESTAGLPVSAASREMVAVTDAVTVETVPVDAKDAGKEAEGADSQAAKPEAASSGRRRAPRRKRGPAAKDTGEAVTAGEGGDLAAADAAAGSPTEAKPAAEAETVKPARPARKRAPRRKKPVVAEERNQEQEQEQEQAEPVSVEDVPPEESAEAVAAESDQEPKRKSGQRRSRGRRGRGRQAKEAGAEAKEQDVEGETGEIELETRSADRQDFAEDEDSDERDFELDSEDGELAEGDDKSDLVLKLLINAEEPEECRLALLENGRLESIHVSTINRAQTKNNIYKARIVAIEPNLQAAFVDYGTEKNGFLPFSEIHPEYYRQELPDHIQKLVDTHHWKKLSITDVVEKGQEVMVQVVKEEVGKKGANMTTYLSLPGRSVVLMPGSDSSGISRKISGEERRSKLRKAMTALEIPEGIGWIVRTAGVDITKTALSRDVGYLLRLWEEIKKKAQTLEGVGQVYEDHQSVLRFLREHFDPAIDEILVDAKDAMDQVKEFVSLLPSAQRNVKVRMHKGSRPIFNQYSVEDQIESIYQPRVNLPSGGSIVIEPTEALVSIDVNSGSTSKGRNFDQSIYQANMEAAGELGRQLRLRDLGGLIVVDFIDMRNKKHIRDVERRVKLAMRSDKAKVDFSRISKFGLMQISRQKLGSPIEAGNYRVCSHCRGRGTVRSVETLALFYLRRIQTGASRRHVAKVECHFPLDVAQYLLNNKRHEIHEHETRYNTEIAILPDPSMTPVENEIILHKAEKEEDGKKQA
ncbi:Rne/Rng family ribonuclease [Desulfosediminicola sp.]|uniref:Rne/Rng family ribonuclease n=1 Tax=Desulfosediminicola sp. TaxID=2886825 RepID=UPI003AF2525E